eukprot:3809048-Amphidinium_carterae.1
MQLIWAMEAKYEGHLEKSKDPSAVEETVRPQPKVQAKPIAVAEDASEPEALPSGGPMLRQRWAILPAEDLPLWLPERIQTKLARSEDAPTRPFLCLLCGLGMGQPSKRKSFQSIDSLWAHFFARHMDTTN